MYDAKADINRILAAGISISLSENPGMITLRGKREILDQITPTVRPHKAGLIWQLRYGSSSRPT